jgi:hypothetical protein
MPSRQEEDLMRTLPRFWLLLITALACPLTIWAQENRLCFQTNFIDRMLLWYAPMGDGTWHIDGQWRAVSYQIQFTGSIGYSYPDTGDYALSWSGGHCTVAFGGNRGCTLTAKPSGAHLGGSWEMTCTGRAEPFRMTGTWTWVSCVGLMSALDARLAHEGVEALDQRSAGYAPNEWRVEE